MVLDSDRGKKVKSNRSKSKSKSKKSKSKENSKETSKSTNGPEDDPLVDEDGIKKKHTNGAMFRKVQLRSDDYLWWGLNEKWDDKWCGDLISFQLPPPATDPMLKSTGAFQKRKEIKPWEIESREETSTYAWGDGGEGRIGSGYGISDQTIPTLVNRIVDPPPLTPLNNMTKTNLKTLNNNFLDKNHGNDDKKNHSTASSSSQTKHGAGRIIDVAAGQRHSLCVTEDGVVYAWGDGRAGQLGSRKVEHFSKRSDYDQLAIVDDDDNNNNDDNMRSSLDTGAATGFGQSAAKKALEKKKALRNGNNTGGKVAITGKGLFELMNCTGAAAKSARRVRLTKPCAVTPSGHLKRNRDVITQQVEAGATCSYAREANPFDGERSVEGLKDMKALVQKLFDVNQDSFTLAELRSYLYEERNRLDRAYSGRVMSWGSGKRGELGLGKNVAQRMRPTPIPFFNNIVVREISAGKRHVLACDTSGLLYSWGCGADGRLGHNDFEDRWEPTLIACLQHAVVSCFCAGDAHSVANVESVRTVVKNNAQSGDDVEFDDIDDISLTSKEISVGRGGIRGQGLSLHELACLAFPPAMYSWGRGAHGRLGLGRNSNKKSPTRVDDWPDSYKGYNVLRIACGGAHTLVLTERPAQPSLANKFGTHRQVFAFGCGHSGQLGNNELVDQYTPVRVKLPNHELIISVSAGKCHSMVLTINGDAYSWGKNWYGELGTGDRDLTPSPVLIGRHKAKPPPEQPSSGILGMSRGGVNTANSGLGASRANTAGNRALLRPGSILGGGLGGAVNTLHRNYRKTNHSSKSSMLSQARSLGERRCLEKLDEVDLNSGPVFLRLSGGDRHCVAVGLRGRPDHLKREVIAQRGVKGLKDGGDLIYLGMPKQEAMILSRWQCARRCPLDAKETIEQTLAKGAPRRKRASTMYACITCNLKAMCRTCTLWCHARHGHEIAAQPFGAVRQLCLCGLGPCGLLLCVVEHTPEWCHENARIIQRQARGWMAVMHLNRLKKKSWLQRHEVATRVWKTTVTNPVFSAVTRALKLRDMTEEKILMNIADQEGHASRKYLKLQRTLINIETQKEAIGRLTASTGALDPHPSVRERWYDPNLMLTVDLSPHIRKLRATSKSLVKSTKPPARLGVQIPVTDAEIQKKIEDEAAAALEKERLDLIQEIEDNGGASNRKNKDLVSKLKEMTKNDATALPTTNGGGRIGGTGISNKPDDNPILNPISPYHRHLSRQSLRAAQRYYREHERLRPCSKLEVSLTKDLPPAGQNLHRIYDVDVNQFIEIARSAGSLAYQPDPIFPSANQQQGGGVGGIAAASASRPSTRGLGGGVKGQNRGRIQEDPTKPQRRRSASLAAPENLYRRVCTLRPAMQRNLKVKRSNSFDSRSKVVKGLTEEDVRLDLSLGGQSIGDGIRNSTNVMKRALLPKDLIPNHLASKGILPKTKGGKALGKRKTYPHMLVPILPLSPCLEVTPLLERVNDRKANKVISGVENREGDVFNMVEQASREIQARHHLGNRGNRQFNKQPPKRRHSLSAPERVNLMIELWTRHQGVVASVSKNPLTRGENLFTYRSGARNDDFVSYSKLKKESRHNAYRGYYEINRLSKEDWDEEKTLIEEIAYANDYSIDYEEGLDSRPMSNATSRSQTPKTPNKSLLGRLTGRMSKPGTAKTNDDKGTEESQGGDITEEGEVENKDENDKKEEEEDDENENEHKDDDVDAVKWTEAYAADGTVYYYNSAGETAWELPEGASAQLEASEEWTGEQDGWAEYVEDDGDWDEEEEEDWEGDWGENAEEGWEDDGEWEEMMDEEGFTYWFNQATGESQY